jgi:hypothetical protein
MLSIQGNQRRILVVVIALAFVAGVFGSLAMTRVTAQEPSPRTQYESFDLSTPEVAVQTFVDAFHQRDYAGLFLMFAPQTQTEWQGSISAFNIDQIIDPIATDKLLDNFAFGFNHTETEHSPHLNDYLFDSIMLLSEEWDAFLIDLRGDVEILRSEDNTIPAYDDPELANDDETPLSVVDVITAVEGVEGEVTFRMVPTPSGRWQVMQVILSGGDEELLPWSVVSESE